MENKGKGEKSMKKITLRQHHAMFGSHERAAADLGISTNNYALWLLGKYKPSFSMVQKLMARNIAIDTFPD